MTETEMRIAVAEACGWKWYRRPLTGQWAKRPMRSLYHPELMADPPYEPADMTEKPCNETFIFREGKVPDYPNDLNAMHEAEKTLTEKQQVWYLQKLTQVRLKEGVGGMIACMIDKTTFATARQRCEAFLRTAGKWKE